MRLRGRNRASTVASVHHTISSVTARKSACSSAKSTSILNAVIVATRRLYYKFFKLASGWDMRSTAGGTPRSVLAVTSEFESSGPVVRDHGQDDVVLEQRLQ